MKRQNPFDDNGYRSPFIGNIWAVTPDDEQIAIQLFIVDAIPSTEDIKARRARIKQLMDLASTQPPDAKLAYQMGVEFAELIQAKQLPFGNNDDTDANADAHYALRMDLRSLAIFHLEKAIMLDPLNAKAYLELRKMSMLSNHIMQTVSALSQSEQAELGYRMSALGASLKQNKSTTIHTMNALMALQDFFHYQFFKSARNDSALIQTTLDNHPDEVNAIISRFGQTIEEHLQAVDDKHANLPDSKRCCVRAAACAQFVTHHRSKFSNSEDDETLATLHMLNLHYGLAAIAELEKALDNEQTIALHEQLASLYSRYYYLAEAAYQCFHKFTLSVTMQKNSSLQKDLTTICNDFSNEISTLCKIDPFIIVRMKNHPNFAIRWLGLAIEKTESTLSLVDPNNLALKHCIWDAKAAHEVGRAFFEYRKRFYETDPDTLGKANFLMFATKQPSCTLFGLPKDLYNIIAKKMLDFAPPRPNEAQNPAETAGNSSKKCSP